MSCLVTAGSALFLVTADPAPILAQFFVTADSDLVLYHLQELRSEEKRKKKAKKREERLLRREEERMEKEVNMWCVCGGEEGRGWEGEGEVAVDEEEGVGLRMF